MGHIVSFIFDLSKAIVTQYVGLLVSNDHYNLCLLWLRNPNMQVLEIVHFLMDKEI